ncbi:von Willebrand factor A domain-containing protein 7-like [Mytilus trossulus]|uniref:von Willebrand factor A domain-containing protein 7-like n=1 Tax=Mytilus trossulus TaxID=6551 RepID=UPI00300455AF
MYTMKMQTMQHILLFILTFAYIEAFFSNPYGLYVGRDDFTHADITEIGILKAVAAFYEETPLTPEGSTPSSGSLTGIQDITAKKLYDQVYAGSRSPRRLQDAIDNIVRYNNQVDQDHYNEAAWHFNGEQIEQTSYLGSRSPRRLQDAIDNIVRYNNQVDQDHYNEAAWHFNGEQIEQSNLKLQGIRTQLLLELNKPNPDYELSRQLIGQFLHILQMFYSNTNWIEDNGVTIYPAVGMAGVKLLPTAGPSDDACKNCVGVCVFNIILPKKQFLTSGYKSGQDIAKPYKDPKVNTKGKCSHGGETDYTSSAATGGINKDSRISERSPHFYKHDQAAETAIDHTVYFLNDNTNGIRHLTSPENFMKLLQLDSDYSLVFVIDTSGSMSSDLPTIIQQSNIIIQAASTVSNSPYNYILVTFSDPVTSINVRKTTSSADITNWINGLKAQGGNGNDCPEFSLSAIESAANASSPGSIIYVFTDATPKDHYKQEKIDSLIAEKQLQILFTVTGSCSTTNHNGLKYSDNLNPGIEHYHHRRATPWDLMDVYRHLASVSGGHMLQTTKDQIPYVANMFKASLSKSEVLIFKNVLPGGPSTPKQINIDIDESISQFTLKIHSKNNVPHFNLLNSNGNTQPIDNKTIHMYNIGTTYICIVVDNPKTGSWSLRKNDMNEWDVEVTAQSTVDFTAKLMTYDASSFSYYQIHGRPIPDENVTLAIGIDDTRIDLYRVSLLSVFDNELSHYSLQRRNKSSPRAFYMTTIVIPHEFFKLAVVGTTKSTGNNFVRIHRNCIEIVNKKLDLYLKKVY